MKISTEIASSATHVGEQKAIEMLAKAGFDAWDFSMFSMCRYDYQTQSALKSDHPLAGSSYLAFARELKHIGLENGIVCNQSHAPFPSACKEIRDLFKRAIACTAEAGGEICIIHPCNDRSPEENAEMYFELLPFAKEYNVKIAAENMWNWDRDKQQASFAACMTPESFIAHLNAVNDDFFVACLDIGHAEMRGSNTSAPEMIRALGSRLAALHIHDNDCRHDSHQLPGSMNIDFGGVLRALKEVGYSGYFTLEADQYLSAYHADNVFDGMKKMAEAARSLANQFEML